MSKYLDIDAILAEEDRVPATFMYGAYGLGHLDASSASKDIEEQQQIDLPLWLAKPLVAGRLAEVKLPKSFSAKVRESLVADPDNVKLRDKCPTFYETGMALSRIASDEDARTLPAAIKATLATRLHRILVKSHNSLNSDVSVYVNTLTELERTLFWTGYAWVHDRLAWKKRLNTVFRRDGAILGSGGDGGEGLGIGAASKREPKRQKLK